MRIPVQSSRDKTLYYKTIDVLYNLKLVAGNIALNKTLHNHPKVREWLLNNIKDDLLELEREILKED